VSQFAARCRIGGGEAPERLSDLRGCSLRQFVMDGLAIARNARLDAFNPGRPALARRRKPLLDGLARQRFREPYFLGHFIGSGIFV